MRADDDPEVLDLAARMAEGKGVIDWPQGFCVNDACALLMLLTDETPVGSYIAYAPGHQCEHPERLRINAARVFLDIVDGAAVGRPPDEGWSRLSDGNLCTWLSTTEDMLRQPNALIPVSEMPPLD